ncbi:DNA-binding protein [Enterobacter cloacae subsp. dissolvens]|nr:MULTISPECIES: helix-turn-helix domain-containing protein [Enterobacter cloacae complex]KZQ40677.1 DNA-binding protein [Enterobacter cloacae subsp. dissolvens]MBE4946829.1 helix-turn-helix domain-containing protein [Enterobacter cloacae complex sp. P1B]MBE4971605.1 helix-turn-helix domain-containing protein [Enterobacter cloacae complex sp. P11RS]
MTVASKKETANKAVTSAPAVDRDKLMIEELRADPDYAELYLKTALEEINEEGGLGGFLIALRRVLEAKGGIGEAAKKTGLARQSIYRALSEKGNPTITTLAQLASAAGVKLTLIGEAHH